MIWRALALVAVLWGGCAGAGAGSGEVLCREAGASCAGLVFEGMTYPFAREAGSYLFVDGGIYPYVVATRDLLGASTVALPDGTVMSAGALLERLGVANRAAEALVPVAGYGASPAPAEIGRRFADEIAAGGFVMAVMKGELDGFDVVWSPVFADNGAMAVTLFPSPGTTVDFWVNWVRAADVARMDEPVAGWSRRVVLENVTSRFEGPQPAALEVPVSCFGALAVDGAVQAVAAVPAGGRAFEAADSMVALEMVRPLTGAADVVSLLRANVSDAAVREENSTRIAGLGVFAEAGALGADGCAKRGATAK